MIEENKYILTEREAETAKHIAKGCTANEIGTILKISPRTVQIYTKRLLTKTKSRSQAAMIYQLCQKGMRIFNHNNSYKIGIKKDLCT